MGVAAKSAQNTQVDLGKFGKSTDLTTFKTGAENFLWVQKVAGSQNWRSQSYRGDVEVSHSASDLLTFTFQLFFCRVPFELTQGDGDRVVYPLNYGGKDIQLTSEQITAALFTKLKDIGENALGTKVGFVISMAMPAETGAVSYLISANGR